MRRTATVLSGSACCVYGLTFTSHFYGARRTVGYVPFDSATLVTGKLFEDVREAVYQLADSERYDALVLSPGAEALRVRSNMEIYWDRIVLAYAETPPELKKLSLPLYTAQVAATGK